MFNCSISNSSDNYIQSIYTKYYDKIIEVPQYGNDPAWLTLKANCVKCNEEVYDDEITGLDIDLTHMIPYCATCWNYDRPAIVCDICKRNDKQQCATDHTFWPLFNGGDYTHVVGARNGNDRIHNISDQTANNICAQCMYEHVCVCKKKSCKEMLHQKNYYFAGLMMTLLSRE